MLLLLKPITWFPPMWAFLCGIVSSGASLSGHWGLIVLGLILAGPIVCGMSQAANDWCDRHVDAINEPDRPIPSGRIPGRWGLRIALAMSALSLLAGYQLGPWGFAATVFGVLAAWAYSAEPLRLKPLAGGVRDWWGSAMRDCLGLPVRLFYLPAHPIGGLFFWRDFMPWARMGS